MQVQPANEVQVNVRLPSSLYKTAKAWTVIHGDTLKNLIITAVSEKITQTKQKATFSKNKPNAQTLKAMQKVEKRVGLKKYTSVDKFFRDFEKEFAEGKI